MVTFRLNDVNWQQVRRDTQIIGSERTDMPRHIKAFNVESLGATSLTGKVLQHAVDLCQGDVKIVQIEIPLSEAFKKSAEAICFSEKNKIEYKHPYFDMEALVDVVSNFTKALHVPDVAADLSADWQGVVHAMPHAIYSVAPEGNSFFQAFRESGSFQVEPFFHNHSLDPKILKGKKAHDFYLNFVQGSGGTIFLDPRDIHASLSFYEVEFNTAALNMWRTKPYNYVLFNSDIWHSHDWNNDQRCTFVFPFAFER